MENLQILLTQHVGKPCVYPPKLVTKLSEGTLIAEPTGPAKYLLHGVVGRNNRRERLLREQKDSSFLSNMKSSRDG